MKIFKVLFLFSILASALFSCNEGKEDPKEPSFVLTKSRLLSPKQFNEWKTRWDSTYQNYMANNEMKYFNMPLADLSDILDEGAKVDSARFYMGMNPDTIPHLMLVGTLAGVPNFSIIADLTTVCPTNCP